MNKIQLLVTLTAVLALTGRDNTKIPGLVSAEGIVLLNGQPIEGVSIVFTPSAGSGGDRYATSISQHGGKFILHTVNIRGALPGKYDVTFSKKTITTKVSPEEEERLNAAGKIIPTDVIYHIPWKYENARTSGIVIEIGTKGNKDIRIDLQPDDTPPPPPSLI
jgi:hypothetical protein